MALAGIQDFNLFLPSFLSPLKVDQFWFSYASYHSLGTWQILTICIVRLVGDNLVIHLLILSRGVSQIFQLNLENFIIP